MIGLRKYNHRKNLWTDRHAQEGRRTSLRRALYSCPRLARPEGCVAAYDYWSMCGLAGTLLRAGSARDFMGPLGPRSATDLEGLYQGPHRSQSRTGTTRRTWTTNLLRHRDYGIDRRHSGDSPPAHIGTAPRARSSSATRPAGRRYPSGCGPEQRIGGREDSEAEDCRRTRRSNGYVMLPSKGA